MEDRLIGDLHVGKRVARPTVHTLDLFGKRRVYIAVVVAPFLHVFFVAILADL